MSPRDFDGEDMEQAKLRPGLKLEDPPIAPGAGMVDMEVDIEEDNWVQISWWRAS